MIGEDGLREADDVTQVGVLIDVAYHGIDVFGQGVFIIIIVVSVSMFLLLLNILSIMVFVIMFSRRGIRRREEHVCDRVIMDVEMRVENVMCFEGKEHGDDDFANIGLEEGAFIIRSPEAVGISVVDAFTEDVSVLEDGGDEIGEVAVISVKRSNEMIVLIDETKGFIIRRFDEAGDISSRRKSDGNHVLDLELYGVMELIGDVLFEITEDGVNIALSEIELENLETIMDEDHVIGEEPNGNETVLDEVKDAVLEIVEEMRETGAFWIASVTLTSAYAAELSEGLLRGEDGIADVLELIHETDEPIRPLEADRFGSAVAVEDDEDGTLGVIAREACGDESSDTDVSIGVEESEIGTGDIVLGTELLEETGMCVDLIDIDLELMSDGGTYFAEDALEGETVDGETATTGIGLKVSSEDDTIMTRAKEEEEKRTSAGSIVFIMEACELIAYVICVPMLNDVTEYVLIEALTKGFVLREEFLFIEYGRTGTALRDADIGHLSLLH